MTDDRSSTGTRRRGPGTGLLIAMIVIGLVIGAVVTALAIRDVRWFAATPSTGATSATRTGATSFVPAQPIGVGEQAAPPPAIDPTLLATRAAALAGALTALEARTAAVSADAAAASTQASRAESLLIAFAARRAVDRGAGLGYLEEQLRTRFGQSQPRAVLIVTQAAHAPVTLEDLRQGLDGIADDIAVGRTRDSWWGSLERELSDMVVLREAGTPSPLPAERMARARRLLDGGQVEAARAEVARLPGAASAVNWLAAAKRYVTARQALDTLENVAIIGQGVPAPPVAAPAVAKPLP